MTIKEDDVVMCTVKSMQGTTVFLHIEGDGEGSMVMSEVAAGRIRNLREYVFPNKKVVCKVLKIINGHPQLSLRRVTASEREQVQDQYQQERTFTSIIKTLSKDPQKTLERIQSKYKLWEALEKAKENPKLLEEFLSKDELQSLTKIISEKKEKEKEVKRIISIKSDSGSGINDLKETLKFPEIEIHYLGSSQFSLQAKGLDFKEANHKLDLIIEEIEKRAKVKKAVLEIKEK